MSSVFLFGAGASYGSGPCKPHRPPLGGQLFRELQALGGVASAVSPELASKFHDDFEKGMAAFFDEHNTEASAFLREMAAYFAGFAPSEGNLYARIIDILGGTRKKAVFVTTNYDLLLELAISQRGLLVTYGGLPVPPNSIPLLKIHGSCNFLPDLAPIRINGISFDTRASTGGILQAPVRPAKSVAEVLEFCAREDSVAPALALYAAGKQVLYCRDFVAKQQEAWQEALSAASRVYLIGLRVHPVDTHIWTPLARSSADLFYVGGEPDEFEQWRHHERRKRACHLAITFEDAILPIARHFGYRGKRQHTLEPDA